MRTVNDILNKLAEFDDEAKTNYTRMVDREKLKEEIETALRKADPENTGVLTEENKNRIERAFDVLKREATGTTRIKRISQNPYTIETKNLPTSSAKVSDFLKNKVLIFEEHSVSLCKEEDIALIKEVYDNSPRKNVIEVENRYLYKCPLNVAILSHSNERDFGKYLIRNEYIQKIDAWIKSVDRGFYDIPYTYRTGSTSSLARGGGHQKWAKFNPDFFIKIGTDILVVEIKSDEDLTEENKAKLKYAKIHFDELNNKQKVRKYFFSFLSPQDFSDFFEGIKNGHYHDYRSNLETDLMNEDSVLER